MLADFSQCTENFLHWYYHQVAWSYEESLNVLQTCVFLNFSILCLIIMSSFLSPSSLDSVYFLRAKIFLDVSLLASVKIGIKKGFNGWRFEISVEMRTKSSFS